MNFVDSHSHIHSDDYGLDADGVITSAAHDNVTKIVCVGSGVEDSRRAIEFVGTRKDCYPSIGLHPHDAKLGEKTLEELSNLFDESVVAIGECGLDYYYNYSDEKDQATALRFQIELALDKDVPLIFHIRDAYQDFWPILDEYPEARGVVHSFSAGRSELDEILSRDLMVGLGGIMTFTKDQNQLEAAKAVPLSSLVLETDAPFLTPVPFRGKINEPKHILQIAEFLSDLRDESLDDIAKATTRNAEKLFNI